MCRFVKERQHTSDICKTYLSIHHVYRNIKQAHTKAFFHQPSNMNSFFTVVVAVPWKLRVNVTVWDNVHTTRDFV